MTTIDAYAAQVDHGPVRFLHRLNPLALVAAPAPAMVYLILVRDVATPVAFLLIALVLVAVGAHLRPRLALGIAFGLPLAIAVMSFSFGLWTDPAAVDRGTVLFAIGDFRFYAGSWLVGLATATRLGAIFSLALLGGVAANGPDMARAMVQQLRVPYRVGYTALAAFRFVPRFGHELGVIRSAHRVRGMAGGRGPIAALRRNLGYIVPLLAGAIRHAERVALAMDARAFGAHRTRTERHPVPFRLRDVFFIASLWAATLALALYIPTLELP